MRARVLAALLVLVIGGGAARGQAITLEPYLPFEGTLTGAGDTDTWTLNGVEGQVISLNVVGSGGLDPRISIANSSGQVLADNDDAAYPDRTDALLQAISLPRIDTYTITVGSYGDTTGDYTLTLLPGYAERALNDDFSRAWDVAGEVGALEQVGGLVRLRVPEPRQMAMLTRESLPRLSDFYAQADVRVERGPNGWRVGLALRAAPAQGYYALMLGNQGAWRLDFIDVDGVARTIRDWTTHPAIVAGVTNFRLSVLANGAGFDVFYNGAFVGQAIDADPAQGSLSGTVGLLGSTPDAVTADLAVTFDDLAITTPQVLGSEDAPILPSRLVTGGQILTVQELERRKVIPVGGALALTVPEASGQQAVPGVNRILLGRGITFGDVVLHTTFTLQPPDSSALVACGLLFGQQPDGRHAVAYLDTLGGYGIAPFEGETYGVGEFNDGAASAASGRHSLIVVRRGARVDLWVDRQYGGSYTLPDNLLPDGQIGAAVLNYQAGQTVCSFGDIWAWTF
jgi:hypothetical protein